MISQEFEERILDKKVHVDYFDEKTGQLEWLEGTFTGFDDDGEVIAIESETDFDRIPTEKVKKIYLKE